MLSRRVKVTIESLTTDGLCRILSDIPRSQRLFVSEHRRLFNVGRGQLPNPWNVTRNQHVITREIFDLPCALHGHRRLKGEFLKKTIVCFQRLNFYHLLVNAVDLLLQGFLQSLFRLQLVLFPWILGTSSRVNFNSRNLEQTACSPPFLLKSVQFLSHTARLQTTTCLGFTYSNFSKKNKRLLTV